MRMGGDGANEMLDSVEVCLATAFSQEGLQPVPAVVDRGQLFNPSGFGRDFALKIQVSGADG